MATKATFNVKTRLTTDAASTVARVPDCPPGMGMVLVRNPGDPDWRWAEFALQEEGDFGFEALQAMAGGTFNYLRLGHGLALVFDDDGLHKRLPFCVVVRSRGGALIPLVGPVSVVRITSTRMHPLRDVDCQTLARHFAWAVA